jgi:hypothetical protein
LFWFLKTFSKYLNLLIRGVHRIQMLGFTIPPLWRWWEHYLVLRQSPSCKLTFHKKSLVCVAAVLFECSETMLQCLCSFVVPDVFAVVTNMSGLVAYWSFRTVTGLLVLNSRNFVGLDTNVVFSDIVNVRKFVTLASPFFGCPGRPDDFFLVILLSRSDHFLFPASVPGMCIFFAVRDLPSVLRIP